MTVVTGPGVTGCVDTISVPTSVPGPTPARTAMEVTRPNSGLTPMVVATWVTEEMTVLSGARPAPS